MDGTTIKFLIFAYAVTTFLPPLIDDGDIRWGEYGVWVAGMTVAWAFAIGVTFATMPLWES